MNAKAETHMVNSKAEMHRPLLSLTSAVGGAPSEVPCRTHPVGGSLN